MSNTYELIKTQKIIGDNFRKKHKSKSLKFAVLPCDCLPPKLDNNKNIVIYIFIINNQTKYERGEHWLAVYIKKLKNNKKIGIYFDSYGQPISQQNKKIGKFLNNNCDKLQCNKKCIQSPWSINCGLFCAVFLNSMVNGDSLTKFLKNFSSKDLIKNDKIVERLYRRLFKSNNKQRNNIGKINLQTGGNKSSQMVCNQSCCSLFQRIYKKKL